MSDLQLFAAAFAAGFGCGLVAAAFISDLMGSGAAMRSLREREAEIDRKCRELDERNAKATLAQLSRPNWDYRIIKCADGFLVREINKHDGRGWRLDSVQGACGQSACESSQCSTTALA